jgi:hypothetical protein
MGMNPMQMNNMGMMGMNNQQNLMDQTALNIKNIIQPYENKIRELEEIIKQKDFEITVLKQKLNNNVPNYNIMNMNPMMNINFMNPMNNNQNNMMMGNINQEKGQKIRVRVENENKRYIVNCFEGDKTSILKEKCNINKGYLAYGYLILDGEKTIKENEILDYSIVKVSQQLKE